MSIDKERLKKVVENETRIWLKTMVGLSINFCGGFDSWVEHLEKTKVTRETKVVYGASNDWKIFFQNGQYRLVDKRT